MILCKYLLNISIIILIGAARGGFSLTLGGFPSQFQMISGGGGAFSSFTVCLCRSLKHVLWTASLICVGVVVRSKGFVNGS